MIETRLNIHNPMASKPAPFTIVVTQLDLIHDYYSTAHPLWMALVRQLGGRRYDVSAGSVGYHGSLFELTPQYTPELVRQARSKGEAIVFTLTPLHVECTLQAVA